MSTIIAQPGVRAHPDPDEAARQRRDRLARATAEEMESALAYLSMIDPQAFEIAFTAATAPAGETPEDEEPFPVCRECGATVGIFLAHGCPGRRRRCRTATASCPWSRPAGMRTVV